MDISVIVPARDEEGYIENCLKSINFGEYKGEIIVVCDSCKDKTFDVAKKYADKVVKVNVGKASAAKNKGADLALGKILIFLDADNVMMKNSIEEIMKGLSNGIIGTLKTIPDKNDFKNIVWSKLKNFLLKGAGWTSGITFVLKEFFDKVNGYDGNLSFGENNNFVRKVRKYGNFVVANSFVINSTRRYEKLGYFNLFLFNVKETLFPSKKEYPVIR